MPSLPPESYGPRELAQDLKRLLDLPAQTGSEQSIWYEEARAVQQRIQASRELHGLPHSLWHFFSDADVRAKEPSIREAQFAKVRSQIDVLSAGSIPPDDSREVRFSELFRELWRAICGRAH